MLILIMLQPGYNVKSLCFTLPELLSCPELHSILRLVLKAGNYMNAVSDCYFLQPDKAELVFLGFFLSVYYTALVRNWVCIKWCHSN